MNTIAKALAAAALAIGFAGATSAQADVLAVKARTFSATNIFASPQALPLDDDGRTELIFETTKNGFVVITYNAECAVLGDPSDWVSVSIMVDGQEAKPASGDDFAFCSAIGGMDQIYSAVTRQSFIKLKPGTHSVRVFASLESGADFGSLDDTSIVVQD